MSNKNIKLNQFGSVLTYAIELETLLSEHYDNAAKNNETYQAEFGTRSKASLKRKKNLERSRRENITEITLEPIEGLDTSNYVIDTTKMDLETINNNEMIVVRFYADAGPKINVLESKRLFKRCHKEHNNLNNLE
jgi:hypothetical protein